jgi:hypothetical protein
MKVNDILQEAFVMDRDPTLRHKTVELNMGDLSDDDTNWAVFAKGKQIRSGITKDQATAMVNSTTLTNKFGKLTAKRV